VSEKDIIALFSNAPDYSEKVTTYQVKQIAQRGYSVPSCATVMTYGLCCAVCKIGSPLNWHKLDEARKKMIKG
jgi:DNA primase large subunit